MREAVAIADPEVDFTPYNLVFLMPPRNAPGIEFSPELNFYQEPLRPDGKVIRNGVTYGQDISTWGYKIINHEGGHDISFPESYNGGAGETHQWVGGWDVMGDILGGAPDYMAWNKWKVGWFDDHDFGCMASDGTADFNLSPIETASDGGLTKKARGRPHRPDHRVRRRAARAARQRRHRRSPPGAHRMCDWGVLLYKVDVTKLNSYGSIRVVDTSRARPPGAARATSTSPRSARARATGPALRGRRDRHGDRGPGDRRRRRHRDAARDPRGTRITAAPARASPRSTYADARSGRARGRRPTAWDSDGTSTGATSSTRSPPGATTSADVRERRGGT